jgi:hypothetical protein
VARTKTFQLAIFTGSCLVTASNVVDCSASGFTFLLAGDCFTTPWTGLSPPETSGFDSLYIALGRTQTKRLLPTFPVFLGVHVLAKETCLQSCCLATAGSLGCSSLEIYVFSSSAILELNGHFTILIESSIFEYSPRNRRFFL